MPLHVVPLGGPSTNGLRAQGRAPSPCRRWPATSAPRWCSPSARPASCSPRPPARTSASVAPSPPARPASRSGTAPSTAPTAPTAPPAPRLGRLELRHPRQALRDDLPRDGDPGRRRRRREHPHDPRPGCWPWAAWPPTAAGSRCRHRRPATRSAGWPPPAADRSTPNAERRRPRAGASRRSCVSACGSAALVTVAEALRLLRRAARRVAADRCPRGERAALRLRRCPGRPAGPARAAPARADPGRRPATGRRRRCSRCAVELAQLALQVGLQPAAVLPLERRAASRPRARGWTARSPASRSSAGACRRPRA